MKKGVKSLIVQRTIFDCVVHFVMISAAEAHLGALKPFKNQQ